MYLYKYQLSTHNIWNCVLFLPWESPSRSMSNVYRWGKNAGFESADIRLSYIFPKLKCSLLASSPWITSKTSIAISWRTPQRYPNRRVTTSRLNLSRFNHPHPKSFTTLLFSGQTTCVLFGKCKSYRAWITIGNYGHIHHFNLFVN